MYKSLFHADIGAPLHVIPTIITERKRDLEQGRSEGAKELPTALYATVICLCAKYAYFCL
jgi:hypothetical protein